jgi:hypothetical protein
MIRFRRLHRQPWACSPIVTGGLTPTSMDLIARTVMPTPVALSTTIRMITPTAMPTPTPVLRTQRRVRVPPMRAAVRARIVPSHRSRRIPGRRPMNWSEAMPACDASWIGSTT